MRGLCRNSAGVRPRVPARVPQLAAGQQSARRPAADPRSHVHHRVASRSGAAQERRQSRQAPPPSPRSRDPPAAGARTGDRARRGAAAQETSAATSCWYAYHSPCMSATSSLIDVDD